MSTKKQNQTASRILNPSPANFAGKLTRLAARMERLGMEMEHYGKATELGVKGIEMQGAAKIARTWARGLRLL